MCQREIRRKATKLINLTKEVIQVYDEFTGDIVSIRPIAQEIPSQPSEYHTSVYYIVKKKQANRLKKAGRPLNDIAILHPYQFYGYNCTPINYLLWGKDHHIKICYAPEHFYL